MPERWARTYDVVVGAADRVRRAGVAGADADHGDRRAAKANEARDVPEDNAEQAQQDVRRLGASLQAQC